MTTLLDIEARSGSGTGPPVDLGEAPLRALRLSLTVTSLDAGADWLDVAVETSADGARWRPAGELSRADGPSTHSASLGPVDRHVRATWAITATGPDATVAFGLTATPSRMYATPADVYRLTLPERALSDLSDTEVIEAIIAASADADTELGRVYTLPLRAWGDDIRQRVCDVAAFRLLRRRGFNPESGNDQVIGKGYDDAMTWFRRVGDGQSKPVGVVDSKAEPMGGAPIVRSKPLRGW